MAPLNLAISPEHPEPRKIGQAVHVLAKIFQGPDFQKLLGRCRTGFTKVASVKPKGSRQESIEQYVVCLGRKR